MKIYLNTEIYHKHLLMYNIEFVWKMAFSRSKLCPGACPKTSLVARAFNGGLIKLSLGDEKCMLCPLAVMTLIDQNTEGRQGMKGSLIIEKVFTDLPFCF